MSTKNELSDYERARDFEVTPEPRADGPNHRSGAFFVIQEHQSSTHHYDLRIEIGGVLKSWAVPKGPSTDPRERRLALPTEDHPVDYADFEGTIPEDEYGGGTVLIWDRGPYRNLRREKEEDGASMAESIDEGKIEVWFDGSKICGGYALIRTDTGDDERWLLIKMDDEAADARRKPTSTEPESVASGRVIEEIAESENKDE